MALLRKPWRINSSRDVYDVFGLWAREGQTAHMRWSMRPHQDRWVQIKDPIDSQKWLRNVLRVIKFLGKFPRWEWWAVEEFQMTWNISLDFYGISEPLHYRHHGQRKE